jgi:DNA helicase-2/ATP-dependent DNA helicase PcrA
VLNVPPRGIGAVALAALERGAAGVGAPLWDALTRPEPLTGLPAKTVAAIRAFTDLIAELADQVSSAPVSHLAREVIVRSGYADYVEARGAAEQRDRAENVRELLTVTQRFDAMDDEDKSLGRFLEQVALVSDLDETETVRSAVTLMTLHSSKGLEFDTVFLAGVEEGLLPHSRSLEDEREMEEERRLCYVGITRARRRLVLTYAYRRSLFGMTANNPPSRFLAEMGAVARPSAGASVGQQRRATQTLWEAPPSPLGRTTAPVPPAGAFRPGEKVSHTVFGIGIVVSARASGDDPELTIAFPNKGTVKVLQSYVVRVT